MHSLLQPVSTQSNAQFPFRPGVLPPLIPRKPPYTLVNVPPLIHPKLPAFSQPGSSLTGMRYPLSSQRYAPVMVGSPMFDEGWPNRDAKLWQAIAAKVGPQETRRLQARLYKLERKVTGKTARRVTLAGSLVTTWGLSVAGLFNAKQEIKAQKTGVKAAKNAVLADKQAQITPEVKVLSCFKRLDDGSYVTTELHFSPQGKLLDCPKDKILAQQKVTFRDPSKNMANTEAAPYNQYWDTQSIQSVQNAQNAQLINGLSVGLTSATLVAMFAKAINKGAHFVINNIRQHH